MLYIAYAIYDRKAHAYNTPFFMQTDGMAVRAFKAAINESDGESSMSTWPEDYTLMRIGTYDNQTGELDKEEPEKLADGNTLVEKKKRDYLTDDWIESVLERYEKKQAEKKGDEE